MVYEPSRGPGYKTSGRSQFRHSSFSFDTQCFNCIFYLYLIDLSLALEVSEAIAIIITQRHCI